MTTSIRDIEAALQAHNTIGAALEKHRVAMESSKAPRSAISEKLKEHNTVKDNIDRARPKFGPEYEKLKAKLEQLDARVEDLGNQVNDAVAPKPPKAPAPASRSDDVDSVKSWSLFKAPFTDTYYADLIRLTQGRVFLDGYQLSQSGTPWTDEVTPASSFYDLTVTATKLYVWVAIDLVAWDYHVLFSDTDWNDYAYPVADEQYLHFPIALFTFDSGNSAVDLDATTVYHEGDIYAFTPAADGFDYTRFRLDYTDPSSVTVNLGIYTCNGTLFSKGPVVVTGEGNTSGDNNFNETGALAAATTYYVWLQKVPESGYENIEPTIKPAAIEVYCGTEKPAEPATYHTRYWFLGEFSTEALSADIDPDSVIRYWIGDIDEQSILPDGGLVATPTILIRTLEFDPEDGTSTELIIYGSHGATLNSGEEWVAGEGQSDKIGIPFLGKNAQGAGDLAWAGLDTEAASPGTQKSIEIVSGLLQLYGMDDPAESDSGSISGLEFVFRTAQSGSILYGAWDAVVEAIGDDENFEYAHALEDHTDYSGGPDAKAEGSIPICISGTEWEWQDFGSIGDGRYWPNTTYANPDTHQYATSYAEAAGYEAGAVKLTVGGVYAAGGAYLKRGSALAALYGEDGYYYGVIGGSATISGSCAGLFSDSNVMLVQLCGDGKSLDVILGDYYHAGSQGTTITNWFGGGILTGSPSRYRIRVADADTGLDVDIEVLGVAI